MIPKELFKKIRQIEIRTKGLVSNIFGGEYHSAFKGTGMDFAEVRPYQFGDDVRNIDWNVSARYPDTFIKIFKEEREQTVLLAVDVSGSEDFASAGMFKREIAAEICAVVAFSAIQNNDNVGLLLFSDQVELFVPPKKGRKHVLRLIRDLFAHEQQSKCTNLTVALNHLVHVLHRRSIVMILSDFMDNEFEPALRAVARRHDTIAVHLTDPVESDLPNVGLMEVTDAETGQHVLIDTSSEAVRESYSSTAARRRHIVDKTFRRLRVDSIPVVTDESYVEPLIRFFRQRNRVGG
ncbi:MAG: DUF58 domain-containing protein [Bacteroidetes bacterium]|nr:DUF58 domain-containing protein [Bacteroidota bacterium]MDA1334146.1 DUF58 domain-containing protein [Bacteroidota bacterium]